MSWKKWGRSAVKQASGRLLELADQADERGGELRDKVTEKLRTSRRINRLKATLTTPAAKPEATQPARPVAVDEAFSFGDARKPAQVFGARSCPWSGRAMRLFSNEGIDATYLDLDHPASGPLREELRVETGQVTVPYVYLRGDFIGGFNALDEIHRLGQLPQRVLPEEERTNSADGVRVEVAQRTSSVDGVNRPPES